MHNSQYEQAKLGGDKGSGVFLKDKQSEWVAKHTTLLGTRRNKWV